MTDSNLQQYWKDGIAAIAEIDEKLDSLDNSGSAGKRAIINELVSRFGDKAGKAAENVVSQLNSLTDFDELVAFVTSLRRALDSNFAKKIDEGVQKMVDEQPVREPLVSEDEAAQLFKDRSEVRKRLQTLQEVILTFDEDANESDYELPPVRRQGAKGARGKRALSWYNWTDGETDFGDSLAPVAKAYEYKNVYALRDAMKEAGIELTKPVDEVITFELPNGKTLTGTRDPNAPSVEEANEEDDEVAADEQQSEE